MLDNPDSFSEYFKEIEEDLDNKIYKLDDFKIDKLKLEPVIDINSISKNQELIVNKLNELIDKLR
jgi:hypothetical protein